MIKSSSDYESIAIKIIKSVVDTGKFGNLYDEFGKEYIGDVVEFCVQRGYLTGINISRSEANTVFMDCNNIKATYDGLIFAGL